MGATLTEAQEALLADAVYPDGPARMTDAQRGVKKTLMDRWRTARSDLRFLAEVSSSWSLRWFTAADVREIFDREAVADIVRAGALAQDERDRRKYADRILESLAQTYANEEERIQIVRDLGLHPSTRRKLLGWP